MQVLKHILWEEVSEIPFLKQNIHDVDIATSAFPEEIKQLFPKTIDIGIEHGTVLALVDDEQYRNHHLSYGIDVSGL